MIAAVLVCSVQSGSTDTCGEVDRTAPLEPLAGSANVTTQDAPVEGTFSANNGDLLAGLALNGEGIALLPRFIIARDLEAGRLVQVLPEWALPEIWLTLYYPPYNQLPLRVATFSDFFEQHVKTVCSL